MTDPAAAVAASLTAANAARAAALARVTVPDWLPSFLAFDLDGDAIPDVLEDHLWTDAMDAVLWAILNFASPNTVAYKAALKIVSARERCARGGKP